MASRNVTITNALSRRTIPRVASILRTIAQQSGFRQLERGTTGPMTRRFLTVLAILAFVAFLAWTTVSAQKVECEVCVAFGTGQNCAKATASGETEAAQSAQTTACGPLARGVDASIACGNVQIGRAHV